MSYFISHVFLDRQNGTLTVMPKFFPKFKKTFLRQYWKNRLHFWQTCHRFLIKNLELVLCKLWTCLKKPDFQNFLFLKSVTQLWEHWWKRSAKSRKSFAPFLKKMLFCIFRQGKDFSLKRVKSCFDNSVETFLRSLQCFGSISVSKKKLVSKRMFRLKIFLREIRKTFWQPCWKWDKTFVAKNLEW